MADDPANGTVNKTITVKLRIGATVYIYALVEYTATDAQGNSQRYSLEPLGPRPGTPFTAMVGTNRSIKVDLCIF